MKKNNQKPVSKEQKAFKRNLKATSDFLEKVKNEYDEDLNCSGCNFGALARMKQKQEEKLKETIQEISKPKLGKKETVKKVVVKIKRKSA